MDTKSDSEEVGFTKILDTHSQSEFENSKHTHTQLRNVFANITLIKYFDEDT